MLTLTSLLCALTALSLLNLTHVSCLEEPLEATNSSRTQKKNINSDAPEQTASAQPRRIQRTKQQQHQQFLQPYRLPPIGRPNSSSNITKLGKPNSSSDYQQQLPGCQLGKETFPLGARWKPNLPPLGLQVCVICECIFKQQESCHEVKVTCRRIASECPAIDSCPDGRPPIAFPGRCCKSCSLESGAANLAADLGTSDAANSSGILRSKSNIYSPSRMEEIRLLLSLRTACESDGKRVIERNQNTTIQQQSASSNVQPVRHKQPNKSNKYELNGIDMRVAFKSLQYTTLTNNNNESANQHDKFGQKELDQSKHLDSKLNEIQPQRNLTPWIETSSHESTSYRFPQVPIALKSWLSAALGQRKLSGPTCTLGEESFKIGEVWHPITHPLGIQFCVVCNCIIKVRSTGCYEAQTTCRRVEEFCKTSCPDGQEPITVEGQCCKGCKSSNSNETILHEPIFLEQTPSSELYKYSTIMDRHKACTSETKAFRNI